jgi:hypothetical protein
MGHARAQLLLGTRSVVARASRSATRISVRVRSGERVNARLVVTGAALANTGAAVSVRLAAG